MEEKKENPAATDTSAKAAIERGKKATAADQEINKKKGEDPKVKEELSRDAEQWRNEG